MDMTRSGGEMEKTRLGGQMDMTRSGGEEKTRLGGQMDMTQAGEMEMTFETLENSVFVTASPAVSRLSKQPTVQELPGSESSSANTSVDCGGVTATVKFSGLSLANNTLILPRKESEEEEDELTKCPVQFFYYDAAKPVNKKMTAETVSDPESASASPSASGGVGTTEERRTLPVIAPAQENDAEPEMTTCLGGLAMQASKHQWDDDVTSFLPREESTRAVNFASLRADVASQEAPEHVLSGSSTEPVNPIGDVTSFTPFSSTRIEDVAEADHSELAASPTSTPGTPDVMGEPHEDGTTTTNEEVDVTRIESQPLGPRWRERVPTTPMVSQLEVTAAPGDCDCHHMVRAKEGGGQVEGEGEEEGGKTIDHHDHSRHCPVKRLNETEAEPGTEESAESPHKRLRLEEQQQEEERPKEAEAGANILAGDHVMEREPPVDANKLHTTAQGQEELRSDVDMKEILPLQEEVLADDPPKTTPEEDIAAEPAKNDQVQTLPSTVDAAVEDEHATKVEVEAGVSTSEQAPTENEPEPTPECVVEDETDIFMEEPVKSSQQESHFGILLKKTLGEAPAEETDSIQEVTIFRDLQMKAESSKSSQHDYQLELETDKLAVFSWLEKSLLLVLHLGQKLQPKKNRKSPGRTVQHWTISKLEFKSSHRDAQSESDNETNIIDAGEIE